MLNHVSLPVTISMTILVGALLNYFVFYVARNVSLTVQVHGYISGT